VPVQRGALHGIQSAMTAHRVLLASAVSVLLGPALPGTVHAELDRELYARILLDHTVEVSDIAGTRVDYQALRGPTAGDWRHLVEGLADADPGASAQARLAFWIDVYNILAIDMVARNDPADSIRDVGSLFRSVWKLPAGVVGGRTVTLDEVEHAILRPMGEPRVHAAIVCASLSCPPLLREPYRAETLDAQLTGNTRRFLADPRKGVRVDEAGSAIYLSQIFGWFEEDFEAGGGVLAFVARHGPPPVSDFLAAREGQVAVRKLDYDWSLNAVH
jgi:hypothetical protein